MSIQNKRFSASLAPVAFAEQLFIRTYSDRFHKHNLWSNFVCLFCHILQTILEYFYYLLSTMLQQSTIFLLLCCSVVCAIFQNISVFETRQGVFIHGSACCQSLLN